MVLKTKSYGEWLVGFTYNYDLVVHTPREPGKGGQDRNIYYGPNVTCMLSQLDGEPTGVGVTVCSPHDQFVKAVGRKIAFTRALKAARLEPEQRTELWSAYWSQTKFPPRKR